MTYYFQVLGDYLNCSNSKKAIVANSVDYHTAHFTLDTTWDGFSLTATFINTKTNVSKNVPMGSLVDCVIPWEVLVATQEGGYLQVGISGVKGTEVRTTHMTNDIIIEMSTSTNGTAPADPTPSEYAQILEIASDKYVDAIVGGKTILTTDWLTASDIYPITTLFTPIIVTGTTVTLRTGTFDDYLNGTAYPYGDFYMDYSTDGVITTRVVATSENGGSPNLRRINFTVNANTYELRITSSSITLRRTSGTTNYYIHAILLRFDDYFYYDYTIANFTTKYQAWLYLEDSSREFIKGISFKRYPLTSNGYIRLAFSQKPSGDLNVLHRAIKTDEDLPYAVWMNTEGDVIYKDIIPEPISDLTTVYDEYVCTVGEIKAYVHSLLV